MTLSDGTSLTASVVILAVGVKPEADLARKAGLCVGERTGGIVVDARMHTSDPSIYAVGDVVEIKDLVSGAPAAIALAGPANRQGRIAADNICGRGDSVYHATQGTAIVRVFAQVLAMTGMTEKAAKRAGIAHGVVYTHSVSHASYYPGSSAIHLKLVYVEWCLVVVVCWCWLNGRECDKLLRSLCCCEASFLSTNKYVVFLHSQVLTSDWQSAWCASGWCGWRRQTYRRSCNSDSSWDDCRGAVESFSLHFKTVLFTVSLAGQSKTPSF